MRLHHAPRREVWVWSGDGWTKVGALSPYFVPSLLATSIPGSPPKVHPAQDLEGPARESGGGYRGPSPIHLAKAPPRPLHGRLMAKVLGWARDLLKKVHR